MVQDNMFRLLPSVDKLLKEERITELFVRYDRNFIKSILENILNNLRNEITSGGISKKDLVRRLSDIEQELITAIEQNTSSYLKHVINCTGVIIHTNIGRSPIPRLLFERTAELAGRYTNLEFDLETGKRSSRHNILDLIIERMFPGYRSIVVNNNAAAVMLILNTFSAGKEVIISRGQMVEIGGSFRIPEVMEKSGALIREVGTTNKTRISDYKNAISETTGLLMTVHPSNYKITGFTETVEPWDLLPIAASNNLPFFHDMGSGNMFDEGEIRFPGEPSVRTLTEKKIPLISFSGDKLMGGIQAGIILGHADLIEKLRDNQLLRALRADKVVYLMIETLLSLYQTGRYKDVLPVYKMLTTDVEDMRTGIAKISSRIKNPDLQMESFRGVSMVGGGAAPDVEIETVLIGLRHKKLSPNGLQKALLNADPPVISRVEADKVILDIRTVFEDEVDILISILNGI